MAIDDFCEEKNEVFKAPMFEPKEDKKSVTNDGLAMRSSLTKDLRKDELLIMRLQQMKWTELKEWQHKSGKVVFWAP